MVLKAMKFVHFWIFTVKFKLNRLSLYSVIQCNGLESNKKFFEKKLSEKNIFVTKKFYEKTNLDKKFGQEIFQSSQVWIFSKGHVKNNVFHIWNTFDLLAICIQCNILHDATVAMLPNGLQLHLCTRDKVPYKQCLHVPYKSELIIT